MLLCERLPQGHRCPDTHGNASFQKLATQHQSIATVVTRSDQHQHAVLQPVRSLQTPVGHALTDGFHQGGHGKTTGQPLLLQRQHLVGADQEMIGIGGWPEHCQVPWDLTMEREARSRPKPMTATSSSLAATTAGAQALERLQAWPGEHRVAVGLSGGVDSLTAALLVEAGWEVEGSRCG